MTDVPQRTKPPRRRPSTSAFRYAVLSITAVVILFLISSFSHRSINDGSHTHRAGSVDTTHDLLQQEVQNLSPGLSNRSVLSQRRRAAVCSSKLAMLDLVCVGDSITYGDGSHVIYPSGSPPRRPSSYPGNYPLMLQEMLRNLCGSTSASTLFIRNFGKGSRTLSPDNKFSYRRTSEYRQALAALHSTANSLLVFLGTNDVKPRHWKGREEYEHAHEFMMQSLCAPPNSTSGGREKRLDSIWLVIPPPAFPNPKTVAGAPPSVQHDSNDPSDDDDRSGGVGRLTSKYLGGINGSMLQSDVAPAVASIWQRAQLVHEENDTQPKGLLSWRKSPSRCTTAKVFIVDLRTVFWFLNDAERRLQRDRGTKEDYALVSKYFLDGIHPTLVSQRLITHAFLEAILEADL